MDASLGSMRVSYERGRLRRVDLAEDPFAQFAAWMHEAVAAGLPEPNAMVLATADPQARPSVRHVLLKELDARGFVFFTNYGSRKAVELDANPAAALAFPWFAMQRQVLGEGRVERVTGPESAAYWAQRPRESQLGAWASAQSQPVESREVLEAQLAAATERFPGEVPLPDFWGGYRLVPTEVEFWQGGPGRMHDRLRYARTGAGWEITRLQP